VYLKPNIQIEPLIDQWYAWPHLIPPATTARNITERHLKIMDSYVSAPMVHANAVKNPKMLGGPFIDYGGKRVDEIKRLRDHTKSSRGDLINLSSAIATLDAMLQQKAKGFSLHPLYEQIPPALRGYVELVYDLNHHPSFRLIEPLLYRSKLYSDKAQSLMISQTGGDDRPFVLSTPRLPSDESIHVQMPFSSNAIDELQRMKYAPKSLVEMKEMFNIREDQEGLFESFFTSRPARRSEPYTGPGVRWRYFGHACILIETGGLSLLFDPVISYTYKSDIPRYTYEDLPDTIDYVLITHNHQDHILFETLLQIRHKVKSIIVPRNLTGALQDPSLKLTLETIGFKNVFELGSLESIPFDLGSITGLPFLGEHADLDIRSKLAYLIRAGGRTLLFAADSCNIEPAVYDHIHEFTGDIDILFIGMECDGAPLTWLYGPLLTSRIERGMDESRRLAGSNCDQGMEIINRFRCREVYIYAMGQEPWLNHVMSLKYTAESKPITESNRLIESCKTRGILAERLFGEKEILLP
jgi:L-ascorbate metabolism protein UlaG (beta-lactamase superfamily)